MATLFEGKPAHWDIAEMDLGEARLTLTRRLARLAAIWALAGIVTVGACLAGLEVAHAASDAKPESGGPALAAGLSLLFAGTAALAGVMASRTFGRRPRRPGL